MIVDEKKSYVYGIFIGDEEMPRYIGKGTGGRMFMHVKNAKTDLGKNRNEDKNRGILNALESGLRVEPRKLFENLSHDEAYDIELKLILEIGRADLGSGPLWNRYSGGKRPGMNQSPITRLKRSIAMRGNKNGIGNKSGTGKKLPQEHKDRIGATNKIVMVGKHHSDATKEKIGLAQKDRRATDETKAKLSAFQKGRPKGPMAESTKKKISIKKTGTKHSEETRGKMSTSQLIRWSNCSTKPWISEGVSKTTWYRRRKKINKLNMTGLQ